MMRFIFATLVLMSVLATSSAFADFKSKPVYEPDVMKMLYSFNAPSPQIKDFGEIASAISSASTQDPLFPEMEEGGQITAAILVAIAWHESRFQRSIVGDQGRSFGLYQIQPNTHRVDVKLLTLPRTASFVAIDLVRKSVAWCLKNGRPWREMLAWYAASSDYGARHPKIVQQSTVRMETMAKVYTLAYGAPIAKGETVPVDRLLASGAR